MVMNQKTYDIELYSANSDDYRKNVDVRSRVWEWQWVKKHTVDRRYGSIAVNVDPSLPG